MLSALSTLPESEKEAYNNGIDDFRKGLSLRDNPYQENTNEYEMWRKGYIYVLDQYR